MNIISGIAKTLIIPAIEGSIQSVITTALATPIVELTREIRVLTKAKKQGLNALLVPKDEYQEYQKYTIIEKKNEQN